MNDEAKIRSFNPTFFDEYTVDRPPAAWQEQPSIATSPDFVYVVWADNRLSPTGSDNDNDVFFARSNLTYFTNYDMRDYGPLWTRPITWPCDGEAAGAYVSGAFDSCPGTAEGSPCSDPNQWFKVDYGGITPKHTWISIQTRVAESLNDLLNASVVAGDPLVGAGRRLVGSAAGLFGAWQLYRAEWAAMARGPLCAVPRQHVGDGFRQDQRIP